MKKLTLLSSILLSGTLVQAQEPEKLSIERIFASPALEGTAPSKLKVSPDGQRVTFIQGKVTDYERYDLWEYNVESGKTQLLFDADNLHSGKEELSDEEKARRERRREYGTGIMEYEWSSDGKALLFPLAGDAWYYPMGSDKAQQILETDSFETDIKISPKNTFISFIREQNLFLKNITTGEETQVTRDGGDAIKNGMAEFVAQEEMNRMTGYWVSPDESKIAFIRVDESPVDIITRTEIYADNVKVVEQRYPRAGTPNVTVKLAIYDIASGKTDWVNLGDNQDIYLARGKWLNNSQQFSFQQQTRDQKQLQLKVVDTSSNKVSVLLTESSPTWINLHDDLYFLKKQDAFVWASEKDGFKHLYLMDNTGKQLAQLTQGDWVVDEVAAIDEKAGVIYFTGRKDTPVERHLYSVSLKGGDISKVSQRTGFHSIAFSKDASIYVDDFSSINTPPQVSLHKASGEQLTWLKENAVDENHPLAAYQEQWVKPEFGTLKTQDGVTLHYRMWTPKQITGKHPAIVYLYGGPIAQVVQNRWGGNRGLLMQHWVDKGYVVFSVDNRGSNYRGKAFEDPIHERMGEIEVQDQVAGVKFLHTLPYVDKEKIGVYGHSYGGYMTLMSMFKAADYFAAGVSGAPVTDWRLYDTHYTERYMGNPTSNPDAYTKSSVFPYAENLKGDLLIYHGMADDNVLFTHSTMLYKHLQDLAVPFEVMDYPGKKHSIRGKQTGIHLYNTITNFFDRNLK
ncbi:S9 family peptidase [Planctobacterium marinum]|uniref:S9 family peptidase n=1 Tax=Planctobacterium marinum TaxID=1631968 RepID=UPI001E2F1D91|nr:S9 family peptidase [Planctobacterium marinum]MCC2605195.1 S9 family peptidase [Planctobacterium marinum]